MVKVLSTLLLVALAAVTLIVDASDKNTGAVLLDSNRLLPATTDDWDVVFNGYQVDGVMVLYDPASQRLITNDIARAQTGYIPASTFKIVNGLIGLELGVVKDTQQHYAWDQQPRKFEAWNQDHTFASAFQHSVVPIFQQIAVDIGKQRMANMLANLEYGNQSIAGGIEHFWLDGQLRVSAIDQIQLLQRLHEGTLPVSLRAQQLMQQVMLSESGSDYQIYAKTGYGHNGETDIGWWVGWLEREGKTVFFALNVDLANIQQAHLRQAIVKNILRIEQPS